MTIGKLNWISLQNSNAPDSLLGLAASIYILGDSYMNLYTD